jgi:hypothetical protein
MVDFVRRSPSQPRMRPMAVVPLDHSIQFALKRVAAVRDQQQCGRYGLERKYESLDHGDRTMLADRAVTRGLDALAPAPIAEALAVELLSAVANYVLGVFFALAIARPRNARIVWLFGFTFMAVQPMARREK